MKYQIVTVAAEFDAIEKLEKKVNEFIKLGWKPLGGVCVIKPYDTMLRLHVSQAMIKE